MILAIRYLLCQVTELRDTNSPNEEAIGGLETLLEIELQVYVIIVLE